MPKYKFRLALKSPGKPNEGVFNVYLLKLLIKSIILFA